MYYVARLSLADLYAPGFLPDLEEGRGGADPRCYALSLAAALDRGDVAAVQPGGLLTLSLSRESFELLGLPGCRSAIDAGERRIARLRIRPGAAATAELGSLKGDGRGGAGPGRETTSGGDTPMDGVEGDGRPRAQASKRAANAARVASSIRQRTGKLEMLCAVVAASPAASGLDLPTVTSIPLAFPPGIPHRQVGTRPAVATAAFVLHRGLLLLASPAAFFPFPFSLMPTLAPSCSLLGGSAINPFLTTSCDLTQRSGDGPALCPALPS